ncbi:MAG: 50S ribosomal protein L25 [Coriobacteriia bacterium]
MSNAHLTVRPRTIIGKANRRLAHEKAIPAVVYGAGREALPVSVDRHDFEMLMSHHAAGSTIVELTIEGEKRPINAMVRAEQVDPLKGQVRHVDFFAVAMNKPVRTVIALRFVNDPAGVKAGGVLTVNRHELNVEAKPADLPESIDVDVSELNVGDSLHAGDLTAFVPSGVTILEDAEEVLASITPPTVAVEASLTETQPEVIGEKSEAE